MAKLSSTEPSSQDEREIRAARNQALFRAVNERLKRLNDALAAATRTFAIACECAEVTCVEMLEIDAGEYARIRAEPRHFAVLPGHVHADVEVVVRHAENHVVVEKIAAAAETTELLAEGSPVR